MSDSGTGTGTQQQTDDKKVDDKKVDDQQTSDKTFTQADLDRIVQERLARVKTGPPADYDDLKAKAAKFDELDAANKSELQRAQDALAAAEKNATAAGERATELARSNAVYLAAVQAGAVDPDAVYALLKKDAVTIGDDGQVTGADDAVKTLLESKPYLVGKTDGSSGKTTGSADGGARGSGDGPKQLTREDIASMTHQQIAKAQKDGQLADLLSGKKT